MMVSTKGRYALRVMLDLAMQKQEEYVSLNDIAQRQKISMKYLESIVGMLNKAGLLQSRRGKDGGYRMARRPEEYPVSEILKLTEGTLAPVSCMDGEGCGPECELLANCLISIYAHVRHPFHFRRSVNTSHPADPGSIRWKDIRL